MTIIDHNMQFLLGRKKGQLGYLQESLGGNIGSYKGHSCIAANFYYEYDKGKMVYFGNYPSVPEEIITNSRYKKATLKIAKILNIKNINYPLRDEIIEILYEEKTPNRIATQVLNRTILNYNNFRKAQEQQALQKKEGLLTRILKALLRV